MKIRDLLAIVNEAQQRTAYLNSLAGVHEASENTWGYVPLNYEARERALSEEKGRYEEWLDTELDFSPANKASIDGATHATNMLILEELKKYLDKHTKVRFCQALMNMGILQWSIDFDNDTTSLKDPFYDTSESVLKRIRSSETEGKV